MEYPLSNACGKLQELIHELELCRFDILRFADTRWTGVGDTITEEGHTI